MQLWTWHEPDFSLVEGKVNHERSEYFTTVCGVPEAYQELCKRLGTDQFIWCYTRGNEHNQLPSQTRIEWVLEVPKSEFLAIVDSFIWNRVLGEKCWPPESLKLKWKQEAITRGCAEHFDQQIQAYHAQAPPQGGWWALLFIDDPTAEGANVLIRHPVPRPWVKSVDGHPLP